jgi:hypothetical protein
MSTRLLCSYFYKWSLCHLRHNFRFVKTGGYDEMDSKQKMWQWVGELNLVFFPCQIWVVDYIDYFKFYIAAGVSVFTDKFTKLLNKYCNKWAPLTTVWDVFGLQAEGRPPIWKVTANVLKKLSGTEDKGWSSSFRVGRGVKHSSP